MRTAAVGAAILLVLGASGGHSPGPLPMPPGLPAQVDGIPYQRGMVYGIFGRHGMEFHRANLIALHDLGVDSVQMVVPHSMETIHATTISGGDPDLTPSRESLEQAVELAHNLGLRVFIFPIVFVRHLDEDEWRGVLAPSDWDAWWDAYEAFILDEARWAAAHQVEIFSVGSELLSTEAMEGRWRDLVAQVRLIFPGLVTYSANWDHLDVIGFADTLDFLGMNAYFEVGDAAPTLEGLLQAWSHSLSGVARWQARHGKPVVVTEIGYPSRRGGTIDPWNYLGTGEPDVNEQDLGYRAFILAWRSRPWYAGAYFYMWWDDAQGGRGYTPRGKPAAETLRRWYTLGQP
ncbi:MAG: hypothetical protein O7A07_01395 [Acidobacteria bacterium]|nr:hypothetical protein [Acidobacteriota bacterium]